MRLNGRFWRGATGCGCSWLPATNLRAGEGARGEGGHRALPYVCAGEVDRRPAGKAGEMDVELGDAAVVVEAEEGATAIAIVVATVVMGDAAAGAVAAGAVAGGDGAADEVVAAVLSDVAAIASLAA